MLLFVSVMEGEESSVPIFLTAGFVSGNETAFGYSDDDLVSSESDVGRTVPGW